MILGPADGVNGGLETSRDKSVTEFQNDRDRLLGKPVARFLHLVISNFIQERLEEINSKGQTPSRMEQLAK